MLSEEVMNVLEQCITRRRILHENAELSFEEHKTTEFLLRELSCIDGITVSTPTATGAVAVLKGAFPGPTVAIRCDIDALPITEETGLPYSSKTPGVMHACGHDGHTAILLTAATLLAKKKSELHGEVRFLFQPAEELPPGGAQLMQKAGVGKGVDEFYGFHLSSNFPTGTFGVRSGALTSATDRFDITIRGKGGHGAFPETCIDPMVVAAQVILALQTIVSRSVRAVEPIVLSVCMVEGGKAYNIIPQEIHLTGSTRTFNAETRAKLPEMMERIIKGQCDAAGASYDFSFTLGYASVVNDERMTKECQKLISDTFGPESVLEIEPLMPGEDFSAFLKDGPGFFVELGARNAEKGCDQPHHNSKYMLDEDALGYGIEYLYRLVLNRLS